jgi:hypothetical protein
VDELVKPSPVPDLVPAFQQLLETSGLPRQGNANAYWQHNLGMTTQVLPTVAGAQSFNAQQLTQTLPDSYLSTYRQ